jgi:hypothetical protein
MDTLGEQHDVSHTDVVPREDARSRNERFELAQAVGLERSGNARDDSIARGSCDPPAFVGRGRFHHAARGLGYVIASCGASLRTFARRT